MRLLILENMIEQTVCVVLKTYAIGEVGRDCIPLETHGWDQRIPYTNPTRLLLQRADALNLHRNYLTAGCH